MDVLKTIQIQKVDGTFVEAGIVRLTINLAQKMIDASWWNLRNIPSTTLKNEGDNHWIWANIAFRYSTDSLKGCVGVLSKENYIEGAIAYDFNAKSYLELNKGCVYIGWLATAPRNRNWVTNQPVYKGIGSLLTYWVVRESYNAGLDGRVSLQSLPTPNTIKFYESKGFVRTNLNQPNIGLLDYELPKSAAEAWLRKEGDLP